MTIDQRQNGLASKRLWWMVAGLLLLAGVSIRFLVHFFTHVEGPKNKTPPSPQPVTTSLSVTVTTPPKPVISSSWRVSGKLAKSGQVVAG